MKRRPYDATRLLKWYPANWRERYGDEFVAYVEDALDGTRPTPRFLLSIALGALRERGHQSALLGRHSTPADQTRAGSLLIFCAWSAAILGGASFSKFSEHFARADSSARLGFDIVAVGGVLGMFLVLIGALAALPSFVAYLRSGGWSAVRRRILLPASLSGLALVGLVALVRWAHHLNNAQRNGGDGAYALAFVALTFVIALTLVSWVRVVVHFVARIDLSVRVLRAEARLAVAVSLLMVSITVGAALWWANVARNAPWFLQGARYGTPASPFTVNVVITMTLLLSATCAAAFGAQRIVRSWHLT